MNDQPAARRRRALASASIGVLLLGLGMLATGLYLYSSEWSRVGLGGLAALAALVCGGLLGFLFGIPRGMSAPPDGRHGVNTNLEQISDWLTKILVGIVLVQLASVGAGIGRLFGVVGSALGQGPDARTAAGALLVFFAVTGFLIGYLLTRADAPRRSAAFDDERARSAADAVVGELAERDAGALRLVIDQLDEHGPAVDPGRLRRALAAAGPALQAHAFLLTEHQRRTNWRDPDTKARMTRTVPILQALTEIEPGNHRYWGELGFALKDQVAPDRPGAIAALDNAIQLRGDAAEHGWELYEFVRALARTGELGKAPLDDATATEAAIKHDLAVAMRSDWIRRKVAEAQRRIAARGEAVDYADLEIERLKPFMSK